MLGQDSWKLAAVCGPESVSPPSLGCSEREVFIPSRIRKVFLFSSELLAALVRLRVMQDATSLPRDVHACHALLVEQARAIAELQAAREKQSQELAELHLTIQKLLARLAGHRSERHAADPNQKQLDFGDDPAVQDGLADAADDAREIIDEYTVRRRRRSRQPRDEKLPEHLERYEVVAEVPAADQHCEQHGPRQIVGFDTTETLEFQRPKLRVRVTKYPKFACLNYAECGLKQPPRAAGLVEGNRYGTCVAAEIITAKSAYHLPTYRQQDWFAGSGWMPGRSTLLNIQFLRPIATCFINCSVSLLSKGTRPSRRNTDSASHWLFKYRSASPNRLLGSTDCDDAA